MSFSNRRKSQIVKADPLLSVGCTNYKDATIDQLRAEASLLRGLAGETRKTWEDDVDKESVKKAQDLLDRYCRERRVTVKEKHRNSIIEYIATHIDKINNPPAWISSKQAEKLASDKVVFAQIDWFVNVKLKKY